MNKKMKCPWIKGNKITNNGSDFYTIIEVFPDNRVKCSSVNNKKKFYYNSYLDLVQSGYTLSNSEPNYDSVLDALGDIVDQLCGKPEVVIREGDIMLDEFNDKWEVRLIINGIYFLVNIKSDFCASPITKSEVCKFYTLEPKKRDVNDLIDRVLGMIGDDITYRF
jgi:hypothetical protein